MWRMSPKRDGTMMRQTTPPLQGRTTNVRIQLLGDIMVAIETIQPSSGCSPNVCNLRLKHVLQPKSPAQNPTEVLLVTIVATPR